MNALTQPLLRRKKKKLLLMIALLIMDMEAMDMAATETMETMVTMATMATTATMATMETTVHMEIMVLIQPKINQPVILKLCAMELLTSILVRLNLLTMEPQLITVATEDMVDMDTATTAIMVSLNKENRKSYGKGTKKNLNNLMVLMNGPIHLLLAFMDKRSIIQPLPFTVVISICITSFTIMLKLQAQKMTIVIQIE